ncbi:hypothetical protein [Halocatena marina]|uniref:Uncharacterized protein n=1 Tax=Halocatena marina TaxID=2934937 RepID=A0ABD5YPQ8_9EURY|nr:hypothetical protein [Halocatena marina]
MSVRDIEAYISSFTHRDWQESNESDGQIEEEFDYFADCLLTGREPYANPEHDFVDIAHLRLSTKPQKPAKQSTSEFTLAVQLSIVARAGITLRWYCCEHRHTLESIRPAE